MRGGEIADLALLIEYGRSAGLERIRFTTSHPKEFTSRLIDTYERVPQLVSHVHLPVQSGADRVLAAMKRGYTVLEYKSIVRRLRAARPGISISSDFIVGFPGETEIEFEDTLRLVDDVKFDRSFSFVYSPRPGTPAASLTDATPRELKFGRLRRLQERLDSHAQFISDTMVGTASACLWRASSTIRRVCRPHRQQSRGEFSRAGLRPSGGDRSIRRRDHHRRPATFAAAASRPYSSP
jgi:tRNA-2-methylthio-N6-dimethylallyladenosine synthase